MNSAGNVLIKVETTAKVSGNRMSVRVQSNNNFTGGLVLFDAVHMPSGCGTWPAFWSNGAYDPTASYLGADVMQVLTGRLGEKSMSSRA